VKFTSRGQESKLLSLLIAVRRPYVKPKLGMTSRHQNSIYFVPIYTQACILLCNIQSPDPSFVKAAIIPHLPSPVEP
jgi:hypothetical protein